MLEDVSSLKNLKYLMSKASAIAINYAKALFLAAKKDNVIDKVAAQLVVFQKHFTADFARQIENPAISRNDLVKIMEEIVQKCSFEGLVSGFFLTLSQNRRLGLFSEIHAEFTALLKNHKNILEAELIFASQPEESQLSKIKALIEKKHSGKVIEIKKTINQKILGGFQVKIGSDVIDASLKNQLLNLKQEFAIAVNQ